MRESWTVRIHSSDRQWVRTLAKDYGTTQQVVLDAIFLTAQMADRTGDELEKNIEMIRGEAG